MIFIGIVLIIPVWSFYRVQTKVISSVVLHYKSINVKHCQFKHYSPILFTFNSRVYDYDVLHASYGQIPNVVVLLEMYIIH